MKYVVYNYEPAGGRIADFDENRVEHPSLYHARQDAMQRLGDLDPWRLWGGHEDDDTGLIEVEAYHASHEDGCGGVHISRTAD